MVTHSSILAWRISWTEEPGGLQSLKSHFCIYIQRNWNHHLKEIPAPRIHCIVTQNTQNMEKTKGPSADEWVFFLLVLNACLCGVFLFIYFNWRLITLQYCGGFWHTLAWISHGCTCVPHPEPFSHLPPHPLRVIPVHQTWAPCLMYRTWTGDLFHIWQHTFQCYSLKSSHPHLLSESPKVCS